MPPTKTSCALGLDYGTNTVRALVVKLQDGREIAVAEYPYAHGDQGVIVDPDHPDLARQHPQDYLDGTVEVVNEVLRLAAEREPSFRASQIVGLGVDTTGSTPLPIDRNGEPLASHEAYRDHPAAQAWLWKDHTSVAEAHELTEAAAELKPHLLESCGDSYSSEWFWAKLLRCARTAPEIIRETYSWIEIADWIPAVLTGNQSQPVRGLCSAGHKGWFDEEQGGYPDFDFLNRIDPHLARIRQTLPDQAQAIDQAAGRLTDHWATRLGLNPGIPIAVGALDAHLGAVGSGIAEGTLVKILGTSTCDIVVSSLAQSLPSIPGLCGVARHSVLPGYFGLEAGQSAVGDIFHWWVQCLRRGGSSWDHDALTTAAQRLAPGESGLLALDWNNGNRSVLADSRLSGLLLGQSLHTRPEEIYRALIEATAFGARMILERIEEYGVPVTEIVTCGGLAEKNPLLMQIYADVTGRTMKVSRSSQTCALGAAIAGAVNGKVFSDVPAAQKTLTGTKERQYRPNQTAQSIYDMLYELYRRLHDAFGIPLARPELNTAMKELLMIRDEVRRTVAD